MAALLLVLFVEQFLDVERQVVADVSCTPVEDPAAEDRGRYRQDEGRGTGSPGICEQQRDETAAGGADEEDVEGDEGRAAAAEAVGHDRLHQRSDHGERGDEQDCLGHAEGDEQRHVRDGVLDRLEKGAEADADADHAQRAGGVLAPETVELGADVEETEDGEDAADGDGDAAVERVQVPAFLEVEAFEDGNGE